MSSRYHAVSIRSPRTACEAVRALENVRFLSMEAPLLPLEDCSEPGACRCRYRHHSDRRVGPRRDSDIGLPGLAPRDVEKRSPHRAGRRATDEF